MNKQSLINAEQALAALLEASSEGLMFLLPDYTIGLINDNFKTILYNFWGIEAEVGQSALELLDLYEVRTVLGQAIEGAIKGENLNYVTEINKHETTFYYEVASYGAKTDWGIIILKDTTDLYRKDRAFNQVQEKYIYQTHLSDFLTSQLRNQDRYLIKSGQNWAKVLRANPNASDTSPMVADSLDLTSLVLSYWFNNFTIASDLVNKKLFIKESVQDLKVQILELFGQTALIFNEQLSSFEYSIASEILKIDKLILAYDQNAFQNIFLSLIHIATYRSEDRGISIDVQLQENGPEDLLLLFNFNDSNANMPIDFFEMIDPANKSLLVNLPKHRLIPYQHLKHTLELINIWGGRLVTNPIPNGGCKWSVSLSFRKVQPETFSGSRSFFLISENLGYAKALSDMLVAEGHQVKKHNTIHSIIETYGASWVNNCPDAILLMPTTRLLKSFGTSRNALLDGLKTTLVTWKSFFEANQLKVPAMVAIQQYVSEDWSDLLISIGFDLVLVLPLNQQSYLSLYQTIDHNHLVSGIAILPTNVDTTYLKSLAGEDPDFWKEMIGLYIQTVPETIAELTQLTKKQVYKEAAALIHKLKSNLKLMGLTEATAQANVLEQQYLAQNLKPDHKAQYQLFLQQLQGSLTYYKEELHKLNMETRK